MGIENRESEADKERENRDRLEKSDKLAKESSREEFERIAAEAGKTLKSQIESTRIEGAKSGGESEKAEFADKSAPLLTKYEAAVREASKIEKPEARERAVAAAYLELRDGLRSVHGTQEAGDAANDDKRAKKSEADKAEKDQKDRLEFSKAMLDAAKKLEIDRRLAELQKTAASRIELAQRTGAEAVESKGKAGELALEFSRMA